MAKEKSEKKTKEVPQDDVEMQDVTEKVYLIFTPLPLSISKQLSIDIQCFPAVTSEIEKRKGRNNNPSRGPFSNCTSISAEEAG